MELKDTIDLMRSEDYKERFTAEYHQLIIRYKKLKKSEDVSEDVVNELQAEITKLTDKYGKEIDKIIEDKTKEILTV